ncbi:unnamed protein product [Blumeria hordei]|uniref:Cyclin-D1-binding protein 1-like N-terminal domain-containing protein n=2 Tax=Blumeria hordei TaxID=2867405 RepID=A0A383UKD9_BLUHO|nr:hypothetical protein BGHDH14_bgh05205 [Blumeria hordei DH14]SZF00784.1 unnamed protein product [Blumeria hordei]
MGLGKLDVRIFSRELCTTINKNMSMESKTEASLRPILTATIERILGLLNEDDNHQGLAVTPETSKKLNVLDLAHDTASLVRAHVTKLSLLVINRPVTLSAVNKVLNELAAGPIPSLFITKDLCIPEIYTSLISTELKFRTRRIISELQSLIIKLSSESQLLDDSLTNCSENIRKDFLFVTGKVWDSCDSLMELRTLGIAGLLIRKAEEYRDLVKDALHELQEWALEESDEEDSDEAQSGEEISTKIIHSFGSPRHVPDGDPTSIRPRIQVTTKKLRLTTLLFEAIIKRRLKTLPALPRIEIDAKPDKNPIKSVEIVHCLDCVLEMMKKIHDTTDDMVSSFYDLDVEQIDLGIEKCFSLASKVSGILLNDWRGQQDPFSTWALKFQSEMAVERLPE